MQGRQIYPSSFGNLLKTYRKRKGMTQKQLAQQLDVHANTVSSWELGTYLPNTRGLVLELARLLTLDEAETRQLLEASLTALSPRWLVPLPRNPFFTGREGILDSVHVCLHAQQVIALTQSYALHGLGGVGKTQIALEYIYRYALEYSAIFWIAAESVESIISGFLAIADLLNLPERQEAQQQRVVAAVQRWLSTHSQWVLIWDNVEDLELLPRFLPTVRQGAVLITTRCQALGTLAQGLELSPMGRDEGMLFVLKRAKVLRPEAGAEQMQQFAWRLPHEYAAAEELVKVMGGLPLALDQAGAYIEETGCSLSGYLHRYEQQRQRLLDRRGAFALDHPQSVATTLRLACQRVAEQHPAALDLLRCCAFLAPDAIPEELLVAGAAHLGPVLGPVAADAAQFDEAIAALHRFSLVQRQPETQTLSLHRLVQVVTQEEMSEQERLVWLRRAIKALDAVFPEVAYEVWRQCERLQAHVSTCAAAIQDQSTDQELFQVLRKTADYLRERSQYRQAASLYERALCIGEQALGSQHPDLAVPLDGLAWVFLRQGKYEQAELAFQRALRLQEQGSGPQSHLTARLLNGLACLYWTQARHEQAELAFQRALRLQEQGSEPQPLLTARLLNNLAELYSEQGKYAQAEPLFQRARHIQEQAMGPEHPNVVYPLDGLAALYYRQGKYELAARLYQRALSIWEQAAGPQHLLIAALLNGLADVYTEQEKGEQAEALYQRALRIREQELGPEHPRVADVLNGLANLFRDQGKDVEAGQLYQRALSIREHHLGLHHPDIAQTLHGLAILCQKQGNMDEALSFAGRALAIRSQSLGDSHPKTVASRALYAQLIEEQCRAEHHLSF